MSPGLCPDTLNQKLKVELSDWVQEVPPCGHRNRIPVFLGKSVFGSDLDFVLASKTRSRKLEGLADLKVYGATAFSLGCTRNHPESFTSNPVNDPTSRVLESIGLDFGGLQCPLGGFSM